MLEKFTKKQEQEMIDFREEWRKIGLSTERIDKDTTKEAIIEMYKLLGKKEPKFIFVPSPFFANLQINFCSKIVFPKLKEKIGANLRANLWTNLGDNLRANLWDNLGDNLRDNLLDNLWANLGDNLRANLWDNLGDNLWDNLGDNLRDNLWDNLGDNLRDNLGDNLRDNLGDNLLDNLWDNLRDKKIPEELQESHYTYFLGQMDSSWIAFYKFPELKLNIQYTKEQSHLLELWAKIAKSSCWWWAFENYVFVSDRPTKLNFNKSYRLHSDTQPAYEFSDGWNAYYLNGVHFPKELWEKVVSKKMSFKEVMAIQDIDQRTQAMAYSPPKDFLENNGTLIDKSKRGNELWKIPQGLFRINAYFLYYRCPSTGKEYLSGIDPKVGEKGNADECMAWKHNLQKFEYDNLIIES